MFSPELLALFVELEAVPARQRGQEWQEASRRLARQLGLSSEWWATCHVHDRSAEPCWPRGYYAHGAWFRCHTVRRALLEAAASVA